MSSVGYWGRLPWHACRLDGRGSACGRSLRNLMKVWALQIVVGGYLAPGLPVRSCRSDRHLTGYLTIPVYTPSGAFLITFTAAAYSPRGLY